MPALSCLPPRTARSRPEGEVPSGRASPFPNRHGNRVDAGSRVAGPPASPTGSGSGSNPRARTLVGPNETPTDLGLHDTREKLVRQVRRNSKNQLFASLRGARGGLDPRNSSSPGRDLGRGRPRTAQPSCGPQTLRPPIGDADLVRWKACPSVRGRAAVVCPQFMTRKGAGANAVGAAQCEMATGRHQASARPSGSGRRWDPRRRARGSRLSRTCRGHRVRHLPQHARSPGNRRTARDNPGDGEHDPGLWGQGSEMPYYLPRGVVALASDPNVRRYSG